MASAPVDLCMFRLEVSQMVGGQARDVNRCLLSMSHVCAHAQPSHGLTELHHTEIRSGLLHLTMIMML